MLAFNINKEENMELYAKGQLSFLILNCLQERDFYGLDIITEINKKSNGRINLKKPSVYSNLTRMEKQNYVSSYLRSSDLGPNRKYYSVTEKGREFYQELKEYFDRNNIDVFRDFEDDNSQGFKQNTFEDINSSPSVVSENLNNNPVLKADEQKFDNTSEVENTNTDNTENNDDFFDFSSLESEEENNASEKNALTESDDIEKKSKSEIEIPQDTNEVVSSDYKEHIVESNQEEMTTNSDQITENNLESISTNQIAESSSAEVQETEQNEYNDSRFLPQNDIVDEEKNLNSESESIRNSSQENPTNNQDSLFIETASQSINNMNVESTKNDKRDDAVFLSKDDAKEYNKRLYDISKDINRYKKRRSFAEDQISFEVDSPLENSNIRTRNNIEEFKNSFDEDKTNGRYHSFDFSRYMKKNEEKIEEKNLDLNNNQTEEKKDDAVYITNRIDASSIEKAKKIEPPRLKVISENSREKRLPAPNRDTSIDPSHKEILSKLYAKTKDSTSEDVREDSLYDYNDLSDFYKSQNIEFSTYKKNQEKIKHNTSKIYFIVSVLMFLLSSAVSAIIYIPLKLTGTLNVHTAFLFSLLPSLAIIPIIINLYSMYKYTSTYPKTIKPQWMCWTIFVILSVIIICANLYWIISGSFKDFATTLILPIALVFTEVVLNYYIKRYAIVKYWK